MINQKLQPYRWSMISTHPAASSENSDALIGQYLEWKSTYAPKAAKKYAVWVKRFQAFTNKAPEALAVGDWTAFAKSLEGRFAPKTLEFALNIVHNYLRFWHEQGRLRYFPLYFARVPKAMARSHQAITEEEYERMIRCLVGKGDEGLRDLAMIRLLHDTGIRVGELVGFEIDQVEEDSSAVIRTEKTVQRRRVYWGAATDEVLHRLVIKRVNSSDGDDWLFVGRGEGSGQPLRGKTVQRMMKRVLGEVGIDRRLSPHSFRHAFIHRLARQSVPDALIAQLVGHSTPHTISHYTKLSRPEFEEVARKQLRELATT